MGPHLRVAVDVGAKSHHVGIANPEGQILEKFVTPTPRRALPGSSRGWNVAVGSSAYPWRWRWRV